MSELWKPGMLTLAAPLHWHGARSVWLHRAADLFDGAYSDVEVAAVFGVAAATPRHTYFLRTRRADRMLRWFRWLDDTALCGGPDPDGRTRLGLCLNAARDALRVRGNSPPTPSVASTAPCGRLPSRRRWRPSRGPSCTGMAWSADSWPGRSARGWCGASAPCSPRPRRRPPHHRRSTDDEDTVTDLLPTAPRGRH